MHILQLAPLWENIPPPAYGGTEAVVHTLVEGLVARGHDVTLVATGESTTSARLLSTYPRPLRSEGQLTDKLPYELAHLSAALDEASRGYDVVHNHMGSIAVPFSSLSSAPMLSTKHCLLDGDWEHAWQNYQGYYCTVSKRAFEVLPSTVGGTYAGHVYNAIDVESFPFSADKEDYVLFLSRIAPEKAPHLAIEAAQRAGCRIVVAGKVDPNPTDEQYFRDVLAPLLRLPGVEWLGEADASLKRSLYARARALLLPIVWEEPFGLVMAEAMACGTPVIAFRRGAAPEVIADGLSGYLVDDVEGMVDALGKLDALSATACRRHALENFDAHVMVDNYIAVYERILAAEAQTMAATVDTAMRKQSGATHAA
ncbi:MAG: glycosyltransferase [Dehalococcoidia bacterium]|nr:glycosyltransferase [Dehalococcoidia bacterium]